MNPRQPYTTSRRLTSTIAGRVLSTAIVVLPIPRRRAPLPLAFAAAVVGRPGGEQRDASGSGCAPGAMGAGGKHVRFDVVRPAPAGPADHRGRGVPEAYCVVRDEPWTLRRSHALPSACLRPSDATSRRRHDVGRNASVAPAGHHHHLKPARVPYVAARAASPVSIVIGGLADGDHVSRPAERAGWHFGRRRSRLDGRHQVTVSVVGDRRCSLGDSVPFTREQPRCAIGVDRPQSAPVTVSASAPWCISAQRAAPVGV
jgi:hypothetical protein